MHDPGIQGWRREIDEADSVLLFALAWRFDVVRRIGKTKRMHGVAVIDMKREEELLVARIAMGRALELSELFVYTVFEPILQYSRAEQFAISSCNRRGPSAEGGWQPRDWARQ